MNIQHTINMNNLKRQRLHEKVEHRVKKLFDRYGNHTRVMLQEEMIQIRKDLKDSWQRRCSPDRFSIIPGRVSREKAVMRQIALELYLIKHGIKYANKLKVAIS